MVSLPPSTQYMPGSSVLDNRVIANPELKGSVLIFDLGKVSGAWAKQLNFLAKVQVNGQTAILPSKAFLMFNTPSKDNQRTPVVKTVMKRLRLEKHINGDGGPKFGPLSVELTAQDKTELKRIADFLRDHKVLRIEATGHTDNLPIRERSKGTFADNFILSVARAKSVGAYLATQLDLPESVLVVHGYGAAYPYASNLSDRGRAKNRRVDLHIVTESMLDASQLTDISPVSNITIEVEGKWKDHSPADRKTSTEEIKLLSMPKYDKAE